MSFALSGPFLMWAMAVSFVVQGVLTAGIAMIVIAYRKSVEASH